MADDPKKRGKPDSDLVSQQPHEVDYLQRKTGLPQELIKKVIEQEGPSRKDVEKYLEDMKKNRK